MRYNKEEIKKVYRVGFCFIEYNGQLYPEYLNRGNAVSFIYNTARHYCEGYGIDVGAGKWPFPGSIPIRNEVHQNAYKLDAFNEGTLDYVFSSHCLEHLANWEEALDLWISKLKPRGILFLYLPHVSMELWRPGSPWVRDAHKWSPDCKVLIPFLANKGMSLIDYGNQRDAYWSFHIVAQNIC